MQQIVQISPRSRANLGEFKQTISHMPLVQLEIAGLASEGRLGRQTIYLPAAKSRALQQPPPLRLSHPNRLPHKALLCPHHLNEARGTRGQKAPKQAVKQLNDWGLGMHRPTCRCHTIFMGREYIVGLFCKHKRAHIPNSSWISGV